MLFDQRGKIIKRETTLFFPRYTTRKMSQPDANPLSHAILKDLVVESLEATEAAATLGVPEGGVRSGITLVLAGIGDRIAQHHLWVAGGDARFKITAATIFPADFKMGELDLNFSLNLSKIFFEANAWATNWVSGDSQLNRGEINTKGSKQAKAKFAVRQWSYRISLEPASSKTGFDIVAQFLPLDVDSFKSEVDATSVNLAVIKTAAASVDWTVADEDLGYEGPIPLLN